MSFNILYVFIPVLLFFIRPTKKNYALLLFWAIICVISYDNVSDYKTYYIIFTRFREGIGISGSVNDKELEFAWKYVFYLFSFTKYGNVLIHSIVLLLTVYTFYKYSRKYDILNYAILMYFLMALIVLHDNIMRQDVAICLAYPVYTLILNEEKALLRKLPQIIVYTFIAFLFHYSAVFLVVIYFFIKYISNIRLNYLYVLLIVLTLGIVFAHGTVMRMLMSLSVLLAASGNTNLNDFSHAMDIYLDDQFDYLRIVTAVFFCLPLLYFSIVSKTQYENNSHLRLCVNLSCFVMVWKCYLGPYGITIFTRPADYLIWFAVWGYSYMLKDIYTNQRKTIFPLLSLFYIMFYMFVRVNSYGSYFGDNNYLSVFSQECYDQKYYDRDIYETSKRVR